MTRDEINRVIAHAAGVDVATTERVLEGLERVVQAQLARGGKLRLMAIYQSWKKQ